MATYDPATERPPAWPVIVDGIVIPVDPPRFSEVQISAAFERELLAQAETIAKARQMSPPFEAMWPELPVEAMPEPVPEPTPAPDWKVEIWADEMGVHIGLQRTDGRMVHTTPDVDGPLYQAIKLCLADGDESE